MSLYETVNELERALRGSDVDPSRHLLLVLLEDLYGETFVREHNRVIMAVLGHEVALQPKTSAVLVLERHLGPSGRFAKAAQALQALGAEQVKQFVEEARAAANLEEVIAEWMNADERYTQSKVTQQGVLPELLPAASFSSVNAVFNGETAEFIDLLRSDATGLYVYEHGEWLRLPDEDDSYDGTEWIALTTEGQELARDRLAKKQKPSREEMLAFVSDADPA